MQIIYKNEDERGSSGRTDSMDAFIYVGRISGHLERKYTRGFRSRIIEIRDYGGIFDGYITKIAELKRLEQGGKIMEEFV